MDKLQDLTLQSMGWEYCQVYTIKVDRFPLWVAVHDDKRIAKKRSLHNILNELGGQGWELVLNYYNSPQSPELVFWLRRRLKSQLKLAEPTSARCVELVKENYSLNQRIDKLELKVVDLKAGIAARDIKIEELEAALERYREQLRDCRHSVPAALRAELADRDETIEDLRNHIAALNILWSIELDYKEYGIKSNLPFTKERVDKIKERLKQERLNKAK